LAAVVPPSMVPSRSWLPPRKSRRLLQDGGSSGSSHVCGSRSEALIPRRAGLEYPRSAGPSIELGGGRDDGDVRVASAAQLHELLENLLGADLVFGAADRNDVAAGEVVGSGGGGHARTLNGAWG
jgi:hypothetical protein